MADKNKIVRAVVLALPPLAVLVMVMYARRAPRPNSSDPTIVNPTYSNLVWRVLKDAHYVQTSNLALADLAAIRGFQELDLSDIQRESLLTSLLRLIQAHRTGDSDFLHGVFMPADNVEGISWTQYGQHRVATILESAGIGPQGITNVASWDVIDRAWRTMVAAHKLTNWWESISLELCQFWVYRGTLAQIPEAGSPQYGEFAGTATGPSMLNYENRFEKNGPPSEGVIIAAAKIVLKFHDREKPIIYIFRWSWSSKRQVWLPWDDCIGVVGKRLPDPFF